MATQTTINFLIKNEDVANHIYNYFLIEKYFNNNNIIIDKKINIFLNYFKDKKYYWSLIFNYFNFNKIDSSIERLIINDDILKIIINKNPNIIRILNNNYRNNELIIKELCNINSYYFKYASSKLKLNISFIMKLLDINIYIYFFIDENLKTNSDIISKIKKINPYILLLN